MLDFQESCHRKLKNLLFCTLCNMSEIWLCFSFNKVVPDLWKFNKYLFTVMMSPDVSVLLFGERNLIQIGCKKFLKSIGSLIRASSFCFWQYRFILASFILILWSLINKMFSYFFEEFANYLEKYCKWHEIWILLELYIPLLCNILPLRFISIDYTLRQ